MGRLLWRDQHARKLVAKRSRAPLREQGPWQCPRALAHLQAGEEEFQLVLHQVFLLTGPNGRSVRPNLSSVPSEPRTTHGGGP